MTQAVYVTFLNGGVIFDRGMSLRFVNFTGQILVIFEGRVDLQFSHYLLVNSINIIVKRLSFVRCITQTPGACEIIVVTAASFAGENIKYDRFAQCHDIRRCPRAVWDPCIPTDRKNRAVGIFDPFFSQPKVDLTLHIANRQRIPIGFDEHFIPGFVGTQKIGHLPHHSGGDHPHRPDALDFLSIFGRHGGQHQRGARILADDFQFGCSSLQGRKDRKAGTDLARAINRYPARPDALFSQHRLVAQSPGFTAVPAGLLHQVFPVIIQQVFGFQPAGCRFFALHRVVIEYRISAARHNQVCTGHMSPTRHINHCRVVLRRSGHQDSIDIIFLHQSVKISLHGRYLFKDDKHLMRIARTGKLREFFLFICVNNTFVFYTGSAKIDYDC